MSDKRRHTDSSADIGPRGAKQAREQDSESGGLKREGRRYAVSQHKGKARGKVRYIETNDPSKGCRFL